MNSKPESIHLEEYMAVVRDILVDFQYIEEGLRMYISNCYRLSAKRLAGTIPFRFSYKDVEKDSLGALVSQFEKLTHNTSLVSELKKLAPHRNEYAHRAFLLTYEEQHDQPLLKRVLNTYKSLKIQTKECVFAVLKEGEKVAELLKS
jgi:hypothetical protein